MNLYNYSNRSIPFNLSDYDALIRRLEANLKTFGIGSRKKRIVLEILGASALFASVVVIFMADVYKERDKKEQEDIIANKNKALEQKLIETNENVKNLKIKLDKTLEETDKIKKNLAILQNRIEQNNRKLQQNSKIIKQNYHDLLNNARELSLFDQQLKNNYEISLNHLKTLDEKLNKVFTTIDSTRDEIVRDIKNAQNDIFSMINRSEIDPIVNHLNSFIQFFLSESKQLTIYPIRQRVDKLEKKNGLLEFLIKADDPFENGDLAPHFMLEKIIQRDWALPKDANDRIAEKMLNLLVYGTQIYSLVGMFVVQQYLFLANIYLQKGNLDMFDYHYKNVLVSSARFSINLLAEQKNNENSGIVLQVISLLQKVIAQSFCTKTMESYAARSINSLKEIATHYISMAKLFSAVKPSFSPSIRFPTPDSSEPFILANSTRLEWAGAQKVYYALQYIDKDGNCSSLISDWSGASVTQYAGPVVSDIPLSGDKLRVIYRKIDNGKPQVVAVLSGEGNDDSSSSSFRDVNRDLFNAAFQANEQVALPDLEIYIAAGADVDASFDHNKRPLHVALENGCKEVARRLLEEGAQLNVTDGNGYSPLHIATQLGNAHIVRAMIALKVDVNAQTNAAHQRLTALHSAVLQNYTAIVDLLVSNSSADVNARMDDGSTALHLAASLDRIEMLKALLASDDQVNRTTADVQAGNADHYTALHLAVLGNATRSVKFLLGSSVGGKSIDVNSQTAGSLITPLHLAALYGHKQMALMLLSRGANVATLTANSSSALHFAAHSGNADLVKMFATTNKKLINRANSLEMTPLYIALRNNYTEAAVALLENCANLNTRLSGKKSMLHLAAQYGHTLAALNLLQANVSVDVLDERHFTPLHYAVINSRLDMAKLLLNRGANANFANKEGQTPLLMATLSGDEQLALQAARMLVIEHDADVQASTAVIAGERSKMTALHWAAQLNYRSLAKFLVNNGARVNATNNLKETPLHLAATYGHRLMTHFLMASLNTTEYVNARTTRQQTALHLATGAGHFKVSQTLIRDGKAFINSLDISNQSPLLYLIKSGSCSSDMYKWFVSMKADVQIKDTTGVTLLNYATANNCTEIVAMFIKNVKPEGNYKDDPVFISDPKTGHTPIYYVFKSNNVLLVDALLDRVRKFHEKNGKVYLLNSTDTNGMPSVFGFMAGNMSWSNNFKKFFDAEPYLSLFFKLNPLVIAAKYNRLDLLNELELETNYNKNFDKETFQNLTAIHYAARNGNLKMLEYLISKNVSINALDSNKNSPIFHAIEGKGNLKLIKYFISVNANYKNIKNQNGFSVVDIAVRANKTEIAQFFINKNVTFTNIDVDKLSPLHITASLNNLKLLKIFIKNKNLEVDALDKSYQTPLYKAINNAGQLKIIKILVENGANINTFSKKSHNSYVHHALIRKKYKVVKYLINKNSNIYSPNSVGETPLYEAIQQGSLKIVKLLLQKGAFLQINNKKIDLFFKIALRDKISKNYSNEKMLNYFVFQYKSKEGKKFIHEAASSGKLEAVKFLLERGVHVNTRDHYLLTPLHFAAQNGKLEIVKLLTKQKCFDVHAKDIKNRTAYDLAEFNSRQEVLKFLKPLMHNTKKLPQNTPKLFDKTPFIAKLHSLEVNTNQTLFLADVISRKITGKKYISPVESFISSKQARVFALNIYDAFQELIDYAEDIYSINLPKKNYFKFYQKLEKILISGKFEKIESELVKESLKIIQKSIYNREKAHNYLLSNIKKILINLPKKIGHWQIKY